MTTRSGETAWCVLLAGLPWAGFLSSIGHLDLWHWQAIWLQAGVLGLWSLRWGVPQPVCLTRNRPLLLLVAYLAGSFLWTWVRLAIVQGKYPADRWLAMGNVLVLLLAYESFLWWMRPSGLTRLWRWLGVSYLLMVAYGYCQWANWDQWFKTTSDLHTQDELVGTIGNPMHYASYLALGLPLCLQWTGWRQVASVSAVGLLVLATGSATGLGAILLALAVLGALADWRYLIVVATGLLLGLLYLSRHPDFLNDSGRLAAWRIYWDRLPSLHPITGEGLGFIRAVSTKITAGPLVNWRHLHNEYLQGLVELGVIGLGLLLACWGRWLGLLRQLEPSLSRTILVAMGLTFLALSAVGYPWHLWSLGAFGLIAFAGLETLHVARHPV